MTRFDEVWTEDIRRIYAHLTETEVIRYTRPDRRTLVWVQSIVLDIALPSADTRQVTVNGITEDRTHVTDEYTEGLDDYRQEIIPLIPELTEAARHAQSRPLNG